MAEGRRKSEENMVTRLGRMKKDVFGEEEIVDGLSVA